MSSDPTRPPIEPSQVFFGEILGARGCLPKERPTKYTTVSAAQVMARAKRSRLGPPSPYPCRGIANDKGNATRRSALDEIPAAGRDSTSGLREKSVREVMPRTNRRINEPGEYMVALRCQAAAA